MATELGDRVWAEWDSDGDMHLFTSDDGTVDEFGAEVWMSGETTENLKKFLDTKP